MKKIIETSKGLWQVVEIITYQEGQYYVDTIGSCYYKLSEITELEASSIVDEYCVNDNVYLTMYVDYLNKPLNCYKSAIQSLQSLLESQGIEITNNTYIFKV